MSQISIAAPAWSVSPLRPAPARTAQSRVDTLLDALLALGIMLSGASQLRVSGVPLGPGEACLFGWAALRVSRTVLYGREEISAPCRVIMIFWVVFGIAQSIGLIRALCLNVPVDWSLTLHDATAYALVALISIFSLSGAEAGLSLERVTRYLLASSAVSLGLQIVSGLGLLPAPGAGPWYWDRFRGWADNPNQLSLFCAVITAIAVFSFETARTRADRLIALTCAVAAFTAGFLTRGNTMRLSLAIGACLFVATLFRNHAFRHGRRATVPVLCFVLAIAAMPAVLVAALPTMLQFSTKEVAQSVSRDQGETLNEADLRFSLWSGAFRSGLESFYLGLGPGPHAPVPIDVTLRRVWDTDVAEESLGLIAKHADFMESHDSYIELFSQGGLLLIVAYGWLIMRAARHALASGSAGLVALLCVFLVFGVFHVIVRHPIVWLALCLCLAGRSVPDRTSPSNRGAGSNARAKPLRSDRSTA